MSNDSSKPDIFTFDAERAQLLEKIAKLERELLQLNKLLLLPGCSDACMFKRAKALKDASAAAALTKQKP